MNNLCLNILNKLQVGIILLDNNFNISMWNGWLERFSEKPESNVKGKSIFEVIPKFNKDLYKNLLIDALRLGQSRFCSGALHKAFIYPKLKVNNNLKLRQSMQVTPIYLDNSKFILIEIIDVTTEYERVSKLKEFIKEQKSMKNELLLAKNAAENSNKSKSLFLASMSHEIRTPMNGILGMLNLLEGTSLDNDQKEYINLAKASANVLLNTINDILDFSKIEYGKVELEHINFNLHKVIENITSQFSISAKKKGLDMFSSVSPDIPQIVNGDPVRISRILFNLVGNAIKFTNEGAILVTVKPCKIENDYIYIKFIIRDTGIGIPKNKTDKLFKVFTQVDSSTTRKYGGTGLGLIISKQLVELMDGTIGVDSHEGYGSTFFFTVKFKATKEPFSTTQHEKPSNENPCESLNKFSGKILLVEDNPINQKLAYTILTKKGLDVTTALNGKEALDLIDKDNFDLIFMDIQMPEMDGFEATIKIREKLTLKGVYIPIIAMTAYAMKEDKEKCLQVGMDGYISKPIKFKEVYSIISKLIK